MTSAHTIYQPHYPSSQPKNQGREHNHYGPITRFDGYHQKEPYCCDVPQAKVPKALIYPLRPGEKTFAQIQKDKGGFLDMVREFILRSGDCFLVTFKLPPTRMRPELEDSIYRYVAYLNNKALGHHWAQDRHRHHRMTGYVFWEKARGNDWIHAHAIVRLPKGMKVWWFMTYSKQVYGRHKEFDEVAKGQMKPVWMQVFSPAKMVTKYGEGKIDIRQIGKTDYDVTHVAEYIATDLDWAGLDMDENRMWSYIDQLSRRSVRT
jgi:hypothetical protein